METKEQPILKLVKLVDGTELVGQISVSDNDKFLRIEEPLQLKTSTRPTQFGARDDSSLAPWIPFSDDKSFAIPKERIVTIASINKDLSHYYSVILNRLKLQPKKPPLTPQEMDRIIALAEQMEQDQMSNEERRLLREDEERYSEEELDLLYRPAATRTLH